MFSLGIFRQTSNLSPTDESAWSTVNRTTTIRTVQVVNGFQKISQRQLDREKKELEQMRAYLAIYREWLNVRLQREKLDVEFTIAYNNYLAQITAILVEKEAAVAVKQVAIETQRLPQANQQLMLANKRLDIDAAIKKLKEDQKKIADSRGQR